VVAFGLLSAAVLYGMVAGIFQTLEDVYDALLYGLRLAAPYLLFYILLAQLYFSLLFIFG
jgi:aminobenzoyl-glutamate transport protein